MDPLRPSGWEGYVGQADLKRRLDVHITAAVAEGRALPHTLLVGPAGFGKTTIATLIADRMGDPFEVLDRPLPARDLANVIYRFGCGILLLDEIHRYPKGTQEDLLPLLEEGVLLVSGGRERIPLPELTIIGATTEPEGIIQPLHDRFAIRPTLAAYSDGELQTIVRGMADRAGVDLDDETCLALGRAAAGTPRNARAFVLAARDLALNHIDPTATEILEFCQTTADGLTLAHLDYLKTLDSLGGLKGVGLKQICSMIRLDESVVRDLERLLFDRNLVVPTSTGRALTPQGAAIVAPRRVRAARVA